MVTLAGFHYHDETLRKEFAYQPVGQQNYDPQQNLSLYGEGYLKAHFSSKLQQWSIPAHDNGEVKVGGIGISYATIADCPRPVIEYLNPLGDATTPQIAAAARPGAGGRFGGGMGAAMGGFGRNKRDKGKKKAAWEMRAPDVEQSADGDKATTKRESVKRTNFVGRVRLDAR